MEGWPEFLWQTAQERQDGGGGASSVRAPLSSFPLHRPPTGFIDRCLDESKGTHPDSSDQFKKSSVLSYMTG